MYANANPADEILPNLWLGNIRAATSAQWLGEKGIKCVFNCTKDIVIIPTIQRQYRVPVDDNLQAEEIRNLELWSYEIVFKMMREYKTGQPILVHCHAGMQRSAACMAMFLIVAKNMTPEQAMRYIKERRPIAFTPAVNFMKSIQIFEKTYDEQVRPKI